MDKSTKNIIEAGITLAEARWGIPQDIKERALSMLPAEMVDIILKFKSKFGYEF